MVWKIIGILLAAVILLVAALLLLPVRIRFSAGLGKPTLTQVKLLFFTFDLGGSDGKKKRKKQDEPTEKKEKKEKKSLSHVVETVEQTVQLIRLSLDRVVWLLGRFKVKRLYVRAVCAGDDAADTAMEYGLVCAALYPLIGFLEANMRIDPRVRRLEIGCDFDATQPEFETDLFFSLQILQAVRAVMHIIFEKIRQERVTDGE